MTENKYYYSDLDIAEPVILLDNEGIVIVLVKVKNTNKWVEGWISVEQLLEYAIKMSLSYFEKHLNDSKKKLEELQSIKDENKHIKKEKEILKDKITELGLLIENLKKALKHIAKLKEVVERK